MAMRKYVFLALCLQLIIVIVSTFLSIYIISVYVESSTANWSGLINISVHFLDHDAVCF
jgi:hypothetical protein